MNGMFAIITGPSCSGKTTVVKTLLERLPNTARLITTTTRSQREGEQSGVDYIFLTRDEFERKRGRNEFLENVETYGNYYGSSWEEITNGMKHNDILFAVLDPRGTHAARDLFPEKTVIIFLKPNNISDLRARLEKRDPTSVIEFDRRAEEVKEEINLADRFDHVVINEDGKFDDAIQEVVEILGAHSN